MRPNKRSAVSRLSSIRWRLLCISTTAAMSERTATTQVAMYETPTARRALKPSYKQLREDNR
jgi:hypothetical protein